MKYKTEKYIALENNKQGNFRPDGNYILYSKASSVVP